MPEDEEEDDDRTRAARFRESAEALRSSAATLRFDPRRRSQLITLVNGFNRAAALIEERLTAI
jgi:hypothetical protein